MRSCSRSADSGRRRPQASPLLRQVGYAEHLARGEGVSFSRTGNVYN